MFICVQQLLLPEEFAVEDVTCIDLGRHAAGKILERLASVAATDGTVVSGRLCIGLFQDRDPRLVGVAALRKIEGPGAGLIGLSIFFLAVDPLSIVPMPAFLVALVVVGLGQVKLVIDNRGDPFAV